VSTATTGLAAILQNIYEANGHELTPAAVVEASRPADAPLHHRFEWDDSIAGERYREVQAAQIIRSVKVTRITDTERGAVPVRAFLAVGETSDDPTGSWTYVALDDLSVDATAVILAQMEKDLSAIRRKYRNHKAALDTVWRRVMDEQAREAS
jgi:hypothetical protein